MKVLCMGVDLPSIDVTQCAFRQRWPVATFLSTDGAAESIASVASGSVDVVVVFARNLTLSVPAFCSQLRDVSDVPLVVVRDDGGELGAVTALQAGADDHCRPSEDVVEAVARVGALVRRVEEYRSHLAFS